MVGYETFGSYIEINFLDGGPPTVTSTESGTPASVAGFCWFKQLCFLASPKNLEATISVSASSSKIMGVVSERGHKSNDLS